MASSLELTPQEQLARLHGTLYKELPLLHPALLLSSARICLQVSICRWYSGNRTSISNDAINQRRRGEEKVKKLGEEHFICLTLLSTVSGSYTNSENVTCTYKQDNSAGVALFLVNPAIWARGSVIYAQCGSRIFVSIFNSCDNRFDYCILDLNSLRY
jgi:hypothetical protein